MIWQILAEVVLLIHFAFIVFVIIGGWLSRRCRWLPWVHLPAVLWAVALEFGGWICPLTPLENYLRQTSGATGYSGGFLEHYLLSIVYPAGLTPEIQIYLGIGVLLINIAAYSFLWKMRFKTPSQKL